MAKLPGDGTRYDMQAFLKEPEARKWAQGRAAELLLGVKPEAAVFAPIGNSPTKALATAMIAEMRSDGLSEGHIHHLQVMLDAWAVAVPNLLAEDAQTRLTTWYADQSVKPNTYNRYLMQGRRFIRWCHRHKHLSKAFDPLDVLNERKVPTKLKEQFTVAEVRTLLHQVDDHFTILFAFLIYTGTRISEALAVTWGDIAWDEELILLRERQRGTHKTGERLVPLPWELRAWLEPRRGRASDKVFHLFRGNANKRFIAYLDAYGIYRPGLTPHSCRHTLCGIWTALGESTQMVSLWLGHSQEKQTRHYAAYAARQRVAVAKWERGQLQFLQGWAEPWPRKPEPERTEVERMRRTLRTGGKYAA
jgi:integrase